MAIALGFVMCGALRLARFNATTFSGNFMGVPITAAGGIVAIVIIYLGNIPDLVLPMIMMLLSWLMISKIKVPKF
ncbi:hypothetical protein N752_14070 [Desulforamulus aquiferis]|nr:hypothetical protein N752_14070 [Desulforamulus aquiferis]